MKKDGSASGLQITFLVFAVALLAAPTTSWVTHFEFWTPGAKAVINRGSALFLGLLVLFGIPGLRRLCLDLLAIPVPRHLRNEVAAAATLPLLISFGAVGAMALTEWLLQTNTQGIWTRTSHEEAMARAFAAPQIIKTFVIAGVLAPIVEELVFRGFLYRAWERRWGWIPAMLLTSAVFAMYHRVFFPAFFGSILFVCLVRRTGSLRASILCHSVGNIILWYPLAGHWIVPAGLGPAAEEISTWSFHIACFAITLVVLGIYIWISRDAYQARSPACLDVHAALPR